MTALSPAWPQRHSSSNITHSACVSPQTHKTISSSLRLKRLSHWPLCRVEAHSHRDTAGECNLSLLFCLICISHDAWGEVDVSSCFLFGRELIVRLRTLGYTHLFLTREEEMCFFSRLLLPAKLECLRSWGLKHRSYCRLCVSYSVPTCIRVCACLHAQPCLWPFLHGDMPLCMNTAPKNTE